MQDSVAPSTQRSYSSAQRGFLQFCYRLQVPALPATEQVLLLYIAEISQRVCHSTARAYLSAIRHLHLTHNLPDPLRGRPRLEFALKGLQRKRPRSGDSRLPITPLILSVLGHTLSRILDCYDHLMIWAACCLGFFAFMRSGELVLPAGATFDPAKHLSPTDVAVDNIANPSIMRIRLKSSKTDQTRAGIDLFVGRTHNPLCPVVAMLRYLALRGFQQGPLFRWSDGSPLTRPRLVDKIKALLSEAGVDPTHYSGHSFRIGAATTAAANGLSDATIQMLGRWHSDSYTRYIRTPRQDLSQLSRLLAN